jgi:hypothetical protein
LGDETDAMKCFERELSELVTEDKMRRAGPYPSCIVVKLFVRETTNTARLPQAIVR